MHKHVLIMVEKKTPDKPSPTASDKDKDKPDVLALHQLDEFDLAKIIAKREYFFIIEKLRQGPLERGAMHKLFKGKFSRETDKPRQFFEALMQQNIIREYEYKKEKPNPDGVTVVYPDMKVGDVSTFYLLVKDFYAIRKPPMELLERLEGLGLPPKIVKDFRKEIQEYFNKYANRQIAGDDDDVINLFMDQKLVGAIGYLTDKIYKMAELTDQMKKEGYGEPTKIFSKLKEKDFIKIIEIPAQKGSVVLLKTAVELQPIFPEYLIRNINQLIAEKKIDRDYAILTLYHLKKAYLELEKPDMLQKIKEKAEIITQKMGPLLDKWNTGDKGQGKPLDKLYAQLVETWKEMGDVQLIAKTNKDWADLKEKMKN